MRTLESVQTFLHPSNIEIFFLFPPSLSKTISLCIFQLLWHKSQILIGPGLPLFTDLFCVIKSTNFNANIEIKEIHYQDNSKRVLYSLVLDPKLELLEQHIGHFFEDYYSECNRTFQDQNAPYNKFNRCFHQFVFLFFSKNFFFVKKILLILICS